MVAHVIAAKAAAVVAPAALTTMATAIKGLYGMAVEINEFMDRHIADMMASDNPTVARTGRVLEMAKYGFGLGYITSTIVVACGQIILGNTLAAGAVTAAGTVATAATLTNPIAMTCAAVGAIYYGWGALSDVEKTEILDKLSKGFEVGVELIKSIVGFIVDKTKELLSSKNLEEMKKFIGAAAETFGRTLSDVTHQISDRLSDSFEFIKKRSGEVVEKTVDVTSETYKSASDGAGKMFDGIKKKVSSEKKSPKALK
jgi:hypothetical protein